MHPAKEMSILHTSGMAISDELEAALAALETALVPPDETADGAAWNDAVDDALRRVTASSDPAAVAPLLLLLDDDYEFQDILWSLLHAAERFSREPYVAGLVEAVLILATQAPDWASRLTGRVPDHLGRRARRRA